MTYLLNFTGRDLVGQKREHGRNGIGRKDNGSVLKTLSMRAMKSALLRFFTGVVAGRQCS
jgi:hypothetical protein